ncbi:hypothetical protein BC826DRAFT_522861 [Russula brevipes]|nr:hypothetical protein BC826DRAFT_522861 [Russula brevipes]
MTSGSLDHRGSPLCSGGADATSWSQTTFQGCRECLDWVRTGLRDDRKGCCSNSWETGTRTEMCAWKSGRLYLYAENELETDSPCRNAMHQTDTTFPLTRYAFARDTEIRQAKMSWLKSHIEDDGGLGPFPYDERAIRPQLFCSETNREQCRKLEFDTARRNWKPYSHSVMLAPP